LRENVAEPSGVLFPGVLNLINPFRFGKNEKLEEEIE